MCHLVFAAAAITMFFTNTHLRASEADDTIESSFKKTYVYKTYLKDDAFKVEAKNGIVTLIGTVAEEAHKVLAQETMERLPGVTRVDNKLETTTEVAAENADKVIGRKVKLILLFHRNINTDGEIAVGVKDGVVTLKGEASSTLQKERNTEYAKDIEGVTDVNNEMTVAVAAEAAEQAAEKKIDEKSLPSQPISDKGSTPEAKRLIGGVGIDDASINACVRLALLTHRSTSSANPKIETQGGEVTLTGFANNATEKSQVTKIATDILGVTNVNNLMKVGDANTK